MTLPRKRPSATRPSPQSSGCCRLRGPAAFFVRFFTRLGVFGRSFLLRFWRGMSTLFRAASAGSSLGRIHVVSAELLDIAPGLWLWRLDYPGWKPEAGWPEAVTSTCVESGGEIVLIDP